MAELLKNLVINLTPSDVLDIGIVSIIIYYLLRLIKGTRGFHMLIGLGFIILMFPVSSVFGFFTVHWILDKFLSSLALILVVVFQNDIRRALTRMGRNPFFSAIVSIEESQGFEELVKGAVAMANKRIGAIVVIEREVGLNDFIEIGTDIDAKVTREMLLSIFNPQSPLHDGAVIIQRGRIISAGCVLPLSMNPNLSKSLGTRHRAAVGITEETDAVAIVVSEELGNISIVVGGKITRDLDGTTLRRILQSLFESAGQGKKQAA